MFKSCCVCVSNKKVIESHPQSAAADGEKAPGDVEKPAKEGTLRENNGRTNTTTKDNSAKLDDVTKSNGEKIDPKSDKSGVSTLKCVEEVSQSEISSGTAVEDITINIKMDEKEKTVVTDEAVVGNLDEVECDNGAESNLDETECDNGKQTDEDSDEQEILDAAIALRAKRAAKRNQMDVLNDIAEDKTDLRCDSDSGSERMAACAARRKSSSGGILKRPSVGDLGVRHLAWQDCSGDDEVFGAAVALKAAARRKQSLPAGCGGGAVGRDELALRRHRIYSELVGVARAAAEHRVRFDPLGPLVASVAEPDKSPTRQAPPPALETLLERLERVVIRLERVATHSCLNVCEEPPLPSPEDLPSPPIDTSSPVHHSHTMSVQGYQDIMQGPLAQYVSVSSQIGGDVATHAAFVQKAFQAQLQFLTTVSASSQVAGQQLMNMLQPLSQLINDIQQFREKNRTSPFFNHLSAISESIPAMGWVNVSPAPSPYVKEMNDAGQFYTNRVLKDWKEKDKKHVEWCKAWVQTLQELQAFVKQFHTTGLVWGGKGGVCPPPPPCGMPPPPPCLPPADFGADMSNDERSALFAQINQGEDITKSLKKVTSDMQTHKNTTLREGPAPFKTPVGAPKPFSKAMPAPGAGQIPDKPPVFSRDGKKWLIEYQRGNSGLVVENAEMNNVVYMFRCRDSSLTVRGKINSIVLDSCTKCAVVFESLVSSVEFVNCQSVQMQVLGKVPTITVDKTDGCQMYLSPDSLDVEVVSSKSSEMNVLIPKGNGDYNELPVAEQFKTTINKMTNSLATVAVESKG